jgi:hypothetical protein
MPKKTGRYPVGLKAMRYGLTFRAGAELLGAKERSRLNHVTTGDFK